MLTYWKGANTVQSFTQLGTYDILNNKYKKIATVSPGNGYKPDVHEFQITPRDTALVLAYRGVKADLSKFGGQKNDRVLDNIVQEVDIKTGAVLFEWHALDAIGFGASQQAVAAPSEANPFPTWDYAHFNAIHWDGKSVLVSARATNTLYRVDRATGRVQWRLRGDGIKPKTGSFNVASDATFGYQHDVRRTKDGHISLFDNGFQLSAGPGSPPIFPAVNLTSSGLVLKLSGKGNKRKASLVKRFSYPVRTLRPSRPVARSRSPTAACSSAGELSRGSPSTTATATSSSMRRCRPVVSSTTAARRRRGKASRPTARPSPARLTVPVRRSTPAGTARPRSAPGGSTPARTPAA